MAKDKLTELAHMYHELATKHQEIAHDACDAHDVIRVYLNMREVFKYRRTADIIENRRTKY